MVPDPRSRRCTRIFRLAITTNITFNKPGAVVALALKPNSSLNDPMAVTWLSPCSTSQCTSLAILCQSALVSGGTSNDAPFSISWSLTRVRSFRLYSQTSDGTSGMASSISPPRAPNTASIGLSSVHSLLGLNLYRVWRRRYDERFCFGAHFVLLLLLQSEEFRVTMS